MTQTIIKYELQETVDANTTHVVNVFDSELLAKQSALAMQPREDREYKIVSVIVTRSTVDIFTVPAYVPSVEEVAEEIIGSSEGSFYIEWGDDFQQMDAAKQAEVENIVFERLSSCEGCGWHWANENLEDINGEALCFSCAQDAIDEEEEDENDED